MRYRTVGALVATIAGISLLTPAAAALAADGAAHPVAAHKRSQKTKRPAQAGINASGGTVQLLPKIRDISVLNGHGLVLTANAPATANAAYDVQLPIASGTLDTLTGYGSLTLTGSYTYTEGSPLAAGGASQTSASFADLKVTLGARSATLAANVNGHAGERLFTLRHVTVVRGSKNLKVSAAMMDTAGVTGLLNSFADPTTFTAEGQFGWLSIEVPV